MPVRRDKFWLRARCDGVAIALQELESAIADERGWDAFDAASRLAADARALYRVFASAERRAHQRSGDVLDVDGTPIVDAIRKMKETT